MTISVKNNHNGYMRSQAIFLATSMSDMLRANPIAVKSNDYNVSGYNAGYSSVAKMCDTSTACLPAELASRDLQLWSNLMTELLPNATGTINCEAHAGLIVQPYSGICTVGVTWTESNQANAASSQTISIVVKP
jgi:type IV pilus assembly protein PilV